MSSQAEPASIIRCRRTDGTVDLAARVSSSGLRKEIFGFLPYWELSDSSTTLDYEQDLDDRLLRRRRGRQRHPRARPTPTARPTVGWSGWTSARMTNVINDAHANQHAGRADRPELRLEHRWREQAEGAARQLDRSGQRSPARSRPPSAIAARTASTSTSSRSSSGYEDGVHRARPRGAHRARRHPCRLPADLRHDGLHRELPDRGRDGRRSAPMPSSSWATTTGRPASSPVGSIAPTRRPALRRRRHDPRVRRPRPGIEAHPRRAVLRACLVDEQRQAQRHEHQRRQVRRARRRSSTTPAIGVLAGEGPPLGQRRGRRLDRLPARELHLDLWLRDVVAAALLRRRGGAPSQVRPRQQLPTSRRGDLGARL